MDATTDSALVRERKREREIVRACLLKSKYVCAHRTRRCVRACATERENESERGGYIKRERFTERTISQGKKSS